MQILNVALKDKAYNIYIGQDLDFKKLCGDYIKKGSDVLLVSNETVAPLYASVIKEALGSLECHVCECILQDGERYKTVDSYMQIMSKALEHDLSRDCTFIALGGGVVGDMTGFAAATYQRGVNYIQIPTTLLSMVDSSVGGKTAINHPLGKNMIGAFYQPKAVFIDALFLKTLPQKEMIAGMAEVIKYGIIYDKAFFEFLEQTLKDGLVLDIEDTIYIIERCCSIKAEVVAFDEKEKGLRAILNLGHTFGHAIEAHMGFGTWLHGEAVGLGMIIAAFVAKEQSLIGFREFERIYTLIKSAALPCTIPDGMEPCDFIKHMHHDKKVASGRIRYVLPSAIGKAEIFDTIDDVKCENLLSKFKSR
ncbi:3-dehydroquinate synthase [Anaerobiospirillum thomasii]|uniref:3-dehydroquinate synthase n=1 Tax=Anaerobiospirillum thomasii TaxID=179995 RepID=A0A2X0VX75_9GAMM|nr:3-dehydroquinate synthase [Anaerobiospirillum thomasii]SPT69699.1 3-dehydroquinate synthase [Anaerobiospirillum thomasii]SPT78909.1 3-dehydroquinate synthase [Anaerobiospirillum thomasii]